MTFNKANVTLIESSVLRKRVNNPNVLCTELSIHMGIIVLSSNAIFEIVSINRKVVRI